MWQQYKIFCHSRWREIDRAFSRFGFFLTLLRILWATFFWCIGTIFYAVLGCLIMTLSLFWWFIQAVLSGGAYILSKICK